MLRCQERREGEKWIRICNRSRQGHGQEHEVRENHSDNFKFEFAILFYSDECNQLTTRGLLMKITMVFDEFKSIYLAIMVSSNFIDINH